MFAYGRTDPRALSAARALRRRPVRREVRRRGASPRLLPLQARMQGSGDARELLGAAFRRSRGRVADRPRASVLRLHRAEDRVPRAAARDRRHRAADAARHLSADSRAAGRREPDRDRRRRRDRRRARRRRLRGVEEASRASAAARGAAPSGAERSRRAEHGHLQTRGAQRHAGRRRGGRRRDVRRRGGRLPVAARPTPSVCSTTRRCASAARPASSACREANGLQPIRPASARTYHAPVDLSERAKTVIKLYARGRRHVVRESAVHALRRSGVRDRVHARRARRNASSASSPTIRISASAAATARSPVRTTCRSSSGRKRRRRSSSASCARQRLKAGLEPACTEVCPRHAVIFGKRSDLLREAKRRIAADARPLRAEGLRRDRRRRHAGAVPLARARSRSSGCPALGDRPAPATGAVDSARRLSQASSRRWRSTASLGVVMWRNRRQQASEAEPDERAR